MGAAQVEPSHRPEAAERGAGGGESNLTVIVALAVNLSIAAMKLVAGLLTGSAAMLAEAAHSVADSSTEVLLLAALRHSERPADRLHPFGYGKVRFFWSLIAAVSIFVTGALFSVYEGVRTIFGAGGEQTLAWVAFLVLGLLFVMEGASWIRAVRQIRGEQQAAGQTLIVHLRMTMTGNPRGRSSKEATMRLSQRPSPDPTDTVPPDPEPTPNPGPGPVPIPPTPPDPVPTPPPAPDPPPPPQLRNH
jgi:hypothetical protein